MESELWPLLEDLEDDIDGLTLALAPLLEKTIPENTAKLPLVDQSKLYVLATYAIESLIFSYLDLNGIKALDHPVYGELTRVKQYFTKIRDAEAASSNKQREVTIDKDAASRFIKHALSGNNQYDKERTEREARERQRAHIRFNELGEIKKDDMDDEEAPLEIHGTEENESAAPVEEVDEAAKAKALKRKLKKDKKRTQAELEVLAGDSAASSPAWDGSEPKSKKVKKDKKHKSNKIG